MDGDAHVAYNTNSCSIGLSLSLSGCMAWLAKATEPRKKGKNPWWWAMYSDDGDYDDDDVKNDMEHENKGMVWWWWWMQQRHGMID